MSTFTTMVPYMSKGRRRAVGRDAKRLYRTEGTPSTEYISLRILTAIEELEN